MLTIKNYDYERAYGFAMDRTPLRWLEFEPARALARGFAIGYLGCGNGSLLEYWNRTMSGMFR